MDAYLSSTEKFAFDELKADIIKEHGPNGANDDRIIRFLKARNFDVKQAKIMLQKNLMWRKEHELDSFLQDYKFPEVCEKYYLCNIIGRDMEGCPIMFLNFGAMDIKGILKSIPRKEWWKPLMYFYELCEQIFAEKLMELGGKPISRCLCIINMEGTSFAQVSSKSVIEYCMESGVKFEANYPERIKTIYCINTSIYFYFIYNAIYPFASKATLQKTKIFGKDGWKEELLKLVDPEVLPAYLGGKRTAPDGDPMCHSIICPGGSVPKEYYLKNADKRCLRTEPDVKSHVLKRRKTLDLALFVPEAGSFIDWNIETDDFDIAFGLFYQEDGSFDINQRQPLVPVQRVDAHVLCETGTYKCEKPGIYILTLDNSYSVLRPKQIFYKVSVKPFETRIENKD